MANQTLHLHPGEILNDLLNERGLSQRELASRLDIAHSLLSNILNGNRSINIKLAISLQAVGFNDANFWLTKQLAYDLQEAEKDDDVIKKQEAIKAWNEIENIVPTAYFKKYNILTSDVEDNMKIILDIYNASDVEVLKDTVNNYSFNHYRKSEKFNENKNNVIAWSYLAEYKAKHETVNSFSKSNESKLISELNRCFYRCFYENIDVINEAKSILNKYGIKFFILERPSQTPVDGKSFICGENPAIVLSLKYSRLDNFAYTLMHELGHVFLHLIHKKYKNENFFINAPNIKVEEAEADSYAENHLIDINEWNEFILTHDEYDDDTIIEFAEKITVHPAIIRGRVCHEYPDYYRKRSSINAINTIKTDHN